MLLRMLFSGANIVSILMYIVSILIITFLVTPFHEFAHAWMAKKLGDDTGERDGRLTLNPLAHIDYFGTLMLLFIGFGWAKPVMVEPRNFKNPKRDMALSALAGPVANIIAAIISGLLLNLVYTIVSLNSIQIVNSDGIIYSSVFVWLIILFQYLMQINIALAVFNFIPIPPLDGSKILMAFLPDDVVMWLYQRQQIFSMVLFAIIMFGGLNGILSAIQGVLGNLILWLTALPFFWT